MYYKKLVLTTYSELSNCIKLKFFGLLKESNIFIKLFWGERVFNDKNGNNNGK